MGILTALRLHPRRQPLPLSYNLPRTIQPTGLSTSTQCWCRLLLPQKTINAHEKWPRRGCRGVNHWLVKPLPPVGQSKPVLQVNGEDENGHSERVADIM